MMIVAYNHLLSKVFRFLETILRFGEPGFLGVNIPIPWSIWIIIWVVPPPRKSHHQYYYIFSRESRPKPSFPLLLGGGTTQLIIHPKGGFHPSFLSKPKTVMSAPSDPEFRPPFGLLVGNKSVANYVP